MEKLIKKYLFLLCFLGIPLLATSEEDYRFYGRHFVASYLECDEGALNDVAKLSEAMHQAAAASGATVLKASEYIFPPTGLTMVLLLSESHASIHTYPEHKACFVDLFTCGDKCSHENFDRVLRAYLKPTQTSSELLMRSETIQHDISR